MHTTQHTKIPHTIYKNGYYHFNLRVPEGAQARYGKLVRFKLEVEHQFVSSLAERLNEILVSSFNSTNVVDYRSIAGSFKPRTLRYSDLMVEYVEVKGIDIKLHELAARELFALAGDKEVSKYTRDDARVMVDQYLRRGAKTVTVRKRINSVCAVLNYAFAEYDIDKRNPFAKVIIPREGVDSVKRGTFTIEQLQEGYDEALSFGSHVRLLFPILGETGCRIGEVVGLRLEDVDLDEGIIHIRPHTHRRLKTTGSERSLPLLGYAEKAMREALRSSDGVFVFPQYYRPNGFVSTQASNALNRWTKARFGGLTAHSLRHTMRDRLRSVEAPLELIDQIGGWSSVGGAGTTYGKGYSIDHLKVWMQKVSLDLKLLAPKK